MEKMCKSRALSTACFLEQKVYGVNGLQVHNI